MDTNDVIGAVNTLAKNDGLEGLEVGPPHAVLELDAVEAELGALLPSDLRDFFVAHGRVRGWEVASTTALGRLVQESRSLTETLLAAKKLHTEPFMKAILVGSAKAVIVGTTDAGSVGYSFVIANTERREPSSYWFFWRDEYAIERVAEDASSWLDAFLGYAIRCARERAL